MQCIYKIDINDRYYIGSTKNLRNRKRLHLVKLRKQYHPNKFLQNLYNKHGEEAFKFSVVEVLNEDIEKQFEIEQQYLDKHFGQENCVNLSPVAGGGQLYNPTPETIQKQLDTRLANGNWFSSSRYPKEAIEANKGSKRSEAFCKYRSELNKERNKDPETLKRFKESAKRGRDKRWNDYNKPFILIKNDIEYGPYRTQTEVVREGLMSNVSLSQLFSGKKTQVKGFRIKKLFDN